jgi:hypothetical protein
MVGKLFCPLGPARFECEQAPKHEQFQLKSLLIANFEKLLRVCKVPKGLGKLT